METKKLGKLIELFSTETGLFFLCQVNLWWHHLTKTRLKPNPVVVQAERDQLTILHAHGY